MFRPCISEQFLAKTDKILFITHLAIGDFTYLQNYFKAFSEAYPHITIDIWIDEVRRSWRFWQWHYLKNYVLHDWVKSVSYFKTVYEKTYSPFTFRSSLKEAQKQHYPLVVSLAMLRSHRYARYARSIAPNGFIVGVVNTEKERHAAFDDVVVKPLATQTNGWHITDFYAYYFERLFGLQVPKDRRFPYLTIPKEWSDVGTQQLQKWGIWPVKNRRIVFINSFAKTKKRSWSLMKVCQLVGSLQRQSLFEQAIFVINSMPESYEKTASFFRKHTVTRTFVFSANEHFFEIPSLLMHCDLIISVETAFMHLACALKIPVVALMRRKNPEWVPYDRGNSVVVQAKGRGWVQNIPVQEVISCMKGFFDRVRWSKKSHLHQESQERL